MCESDFSTADCVLVMGTSLEVEPFSNLIKRVRENVPRLLLNKNSVGPFRASTLHKRRKDLQLLGDLVECVENLSAKLGWKQDLDELIIRHTHYIESMKENLMEELYYKYKAYDLTKENCFSTSINVRQNDTKIRLLSRQTASLQDLANRRGSSLSSLSANATNKNKKKALANKTNKAKLALGAKKKNVKKNPVKIIYAISIANPLFIFLDSQFTRGLRRYAMPAAHKIFCMQRAQKMKHLNG